MKLLTELWSSISGIPLFNAWATIPGNIVLLYQAWKTARNRWQRRKQKAFWNPAGKKWKIVKPKYPGMMARVEDVLAAHAITTTLKDCGYEYEDTYDDACIAETENTIFICSPSANKAARECVLNHRLAYEMIWETDKTNGGKKSIYIKDNFTGNMMFSPMDNPNKKKNSDLGIIGRIRIQNSNTWLLFLFGIHGVGTYGCAQYITSKHFLKECYPKVKDRDFIFLVQVDYKSISEISNVRVMTKIITGSEVFYGGPA